MEVQTKKIQNQYDRNWPKTGRKRLCFGFTLLTVLIVTLCLHGKLRTIQQLPVLTRVSQVLFKTSEANPANASNGKVHVAVAVCGDRLGDVIVLAQSLAMTATGPVVLHAFLEKNLQQQFKSAISVWPNHVRRNFEYDVRDVFLPTRVVNGIPPDFWTRHFNHCAYQRLFLPEALPELDRLIYVDSDTLFLAPVEDLWAQTSKFDTEQYVGISLEQNPGGTSFYTNFKSHPIYGKMGLNTGTILYDLKKMNSTQFLVDIKAIFVEYQARVKMADQGILNILFHFHPERLFEISCAWNFRSDYCTKFTCPDAQENGARLLHANRRIWHSSIVPPFKAAFAAFRDYTSNKR